MGVAVADISVPRQKKIYQMIYPTKRILALRLPDIVSDIVYYSLFVVHLFMVLFVIQTT